jgi:L-alanine-DL-glutamate epimerase-like enolase superfamily enzyme
LTVEASLIDCFPVRDTLELRDGNAVVPERPGWGFTFNRDYIRHLAKAS